MRNDRVKLIENSEIRKLKISSKEGYSYSNSCRDGIFERSFGKDEKVRITEPESELSSKFIENKREKNRDKMEFDPSVEAGRSAPLADFLDNLSIESWNIVIKSLKNRRLIIRSHREFNNYFQHKSLLIRIKIKKDEEYIDIGEGNTSGQKINYSGLMSRIEEIVECNRNSVNSDFKYSVPVILSPGDGGILFHEILGHSLEADHIASQNSPFTFKDIGKKAVSEKLNICLNDKKDEFFSNINCDDEGEKNTSNYLVKKGIIKSLISDTFYGNILGIKSRGFSRQEDFSSIPLPRMFSIYIMPGKSHPEEILASVKKGVYAKEFGEGKVIFNRNLFYFYINSAYMIENGKISAPLGRVVVQGQLDKTFNGVELIGTDFQYDRGVSYCLKKGQFLNVRLGQPTVKISNLTVSKSYNGS